MPLGAGSFVQGLDTPATGDFSGTSGTATLPNATTVGNTVVLAVGTFGTSDVTVSGFTRATVAAAGDNQRGGIFTKAVTTPETSWTITPGASQPTLWQVFEVAGIDVDEPVDTAGAWGIGAAPTLNQPSGTCPLSTTYDGLVLDVHFGAITTSATAPVYGTYTDPTGTSGTTGWTPIEQSSRVEGARAFTLATAMKPVQVQGKYAAMAQSTPNSLYGCGSVVLTATGARRVSRVDVMCGFETGTLAGALLNVAGYSMWDASVGTPAIVTTTPRSGTYCAEMSSAAAAEYLGWTTAGALGQFTPTAPPKLVTRFSVLFPTSLPAADVDLFSFGTGAVAGACVLRYRTSGTKLGMKVSATGTEQFSGAVVPNVQYNMDVRFSVATSTWTADWSVDYVPQTQATLTGQAVTTLTLVRYGWAVAATATVRYDDIAVSKVGGHYPLGDMRIYPLKPDPAGTLVLTPNVPADFNTFTLNGTLAAWNATTALAAISDIPPVLGASADGICQVVASTTSCNVPMQTYNGGTAEVPRAVRWYWCGWASAATANAVQIFMDDGAGANYPAFSGDPQFDTTSTPGWICRMHRDGPPNDQSIAWTQTMLDGLSCDFGGSSDITPKPGLHAVLAEVCMRAVPAAQPLFGTLASAVTDSDSAGIVSVTLTAPTGYDTNLYYEQSTSPTTLPVTGGTAGTATVLAPDAPTTNYLAAYPAAEPDPTA